MPNPRPIEALREWETPFAKDSYHGDYRLSPVTVMHAARLPGILLTAPHATLHQRDGRPKYPEVGTGALALWLARTLGCGAVCSTRADGDANWDATHPLRDHILAVRPTVVIDLHGMRDRPDEPRLCLGRASGLVPESFVESMLDGPDVTDCGRFAAGPRTITAFCQARGIRAVQVEIAAALRDVWRIESGEVAPLDILRLTDRLSAAIEALAR